MVKKWFVIAIISLTVFVVEGCKKNNPSTPTPVFHATPYSLEYPGFVDAQQSTPFISTSNPLTVEGVYLGRKLFYEKMLSNDLSMNCNSCHKQENGFSDPRQFSLGTNGAIGSRNAMALVNLAWDDRFFWDGRRNSLELQAHDPVTNPVEMENTWPVVIQRLQTSSVYPDLFEKAFGTKTIDSVFVTYALAQFERTLISYGSRFDSFYYIGGKLLSQPEMDGFEIFGGLGCANCHAGVQTTDHLFRNNGLDILPQDSGLAKFTHNPADYGKFKVPSLRNIAVTAPYMHDGRFKTLDEVVDFYSDNVNANSPNLDSVFQFHPTGFHFSLLQKANLVAFLKTLTDNTYINNQKFSAPK